MWRIVSVALRWSSRRPAPKPVKRRRLLREGAFCSATLTDAELKTSVSKPRRGSFTISSLLSDSVEETAAADQAFADRVLVSVFAAALRDPAPSCSLVRRELAQFERHQPAPSARGETHPVEQYARPADPRRARAGRSNAAG